MQRDPHQCVSHHVDTAISSAITPTPALNLQGRVKWAIAGRNQAKLESVRKHVAELNPACKVCCCSCSQQKVLPT